jgi:DNA-directed RNA polymerase subunit beta'
MAKLQDFQAIRIKLASPDEILAWSSGEVTKPETINYRTQRPEKDGLFCEKIFGPTKDWECYCGKYRKIRYKGIICDKCGVEVTRSSVRRERMGHIKLASPVTHIWFLRGVPSRIGLLLDISLADAERIVYFASYIITRVDQASKEVILDQLEREYKTKSKAEKSNVNKEKIKTLRDRAKEELRQLKVGKVLSEMDYQELSMKYGEVFEAGTGAEALKRLADSVNLRDLEKDALNQLKTPNPLLRKKAQKRIRLIRGFIKANINPSNMFLSVLPVMPPDLRPMVQLDGGRYASSDLNDLYRRVINRNNRLKKLIELNAPEVICRNEKRMLQEAVDSLLDNSARKGQMTTASTGQKRLLKSLADMLKGKQGRFRQNLLGKRVDYSGRSVIVVGPRLSLAECGLPKKMALELFKPFVINQIIARELAHNIRSAGRLIEDEADEVWAILEEVIKDKYILLNRAPTLHRLGIQAFRPVLIEGMAIQLHPLVCRAFNADFDGDQMAVHLPLSIEAQEEAKTRMSSVNNLLKPATGNPISGATQDIVLGCFYMTRLKNGAKGEGKLFGSEQEAILVYNFEAVDLQAKVKVKIRKSYEGKKSPIIETSVGRIIFNELIPDDFDYINRDLTRKALEEIFSMIIEKYEDHEKIAEIFDRIKTNGFEFATRSGVSWGMDDLKVPADKPFIMEAAQAEVEKVKDQYNQGLLSDKERYNRVISIWSGVKKKMEERVPEILDPHGSIALMIASGARGSWSQPVQMAGMKGLVVNPAGRIIELPIKSNFKEGFNVLEYFISTHGARKGTADTALRTASAGYLTRRLVDVSQDVVIKEEDCGDTKGTIVYRADCKETGQSYAARLATRVILEDIEVDDKGTKRVIKSGTVIDKVTSKLIDATKRDTVVVRSVMTCRAQDGICRKCYGYDLGHNKLIELGEAVGIIAAQAIGEPGTQLTMRTFHTGGVAGLEDITQGLPRVEEIFESRTPKQKAFIAEKDGKVDSIKEKDGFKYVIIIGKDKEGKKEEKEYKIPSVYTVLVKKNADVVSGQRLTEGHIDLKELMKYGGRSEVERYILREVQKIYSVHGESIHDKHVEIIIRQMFSRVKIKDVGATTFSEGQVVEKAIFNEENRKARENSAKPSTGIQLLLGITKVALSTNSFLSAASFQETARVLINTATEGRIDRLRGLKENVIIGRLIPAGTGFRKTGRSSPGGDNAAMEQGFEEDDDDE